MRKIRCSDCTKNKSIIKGIAGIGSQCDYPDCPHWDEWGPDLDIETCEDFKSKFKKEK